MLVVTSIHGEGYDRDCMSFIEVESSLKSYGYKRGGFSLLQTSWLEFG